MKKNIFLFFVSINNEDLEINVYFFTYKFLGFK